ncbi:MAG TPA: sulfatase-like hydrolase/transferase [Planctomycetota bacterium]|nr:sulfatase-like hydrolase/transferase [Planctomycetota bacterium]
MSQSASKHRPNVLLIVTDHWPGALLGVAGHPAIHTPTIDQLADNGTRFTRAYSEIPVCGPARRCIMTGTSPRAHGDRLFKFPPCTPMPPFPTLAQTFRNAGYQAFGVGKNDVFPQRSRIGFDDVLLDGEGRYESGIVDDYELFLGDEGFPGQQFMHGLSSNEYIWRPWHLPEHCHVTNWATNQMCRTIRRRDPQRPGFWYIGYRHPHPPLAPLREYLEMYRDIAIDDAFDGEWSRQGNEAALPVLIRDDRALHEPLSRENVRAIRRAFYALCTHVDHQIRLLIGTLHQEGILDNTIIVFTSDHGDMLGNHGLWAMSRFYEWSTNIPLIVQGVANCPRVGHHRTDGRLVALQDLMPTLLDLAGLEIPACATGQSMFGGARRRYLFGEIQEHQRATRMIRTERHKLIYYPAGNRTQLFDLQNDPDELRDLSASSPHSGIRDELMQTLISELYGNDLEWIKDGRLEGLPDYEVQPCVNRSLLNQRGTFWPPPVNPKARI